MVEMENVLARIASVKSQDNSSYVVPSRCYIIADDLVDDIIELLTTERNITK